MAAKVIDVDYAVIVVDTENYNEEWMLDDFDEFSKAYEYAYKQAHESKNDALCFWISLYIQGEEFLPICLVDENGVIY